MLLALFLTAFILVYDVSHGGQAGILLFLVWPVVFVGLIGGVAGMLGGLLFDLVFPTRTLPSTTPIKCSNCRGQVELDTLVCPHCGFHFAHD